MKIGFIGLGRMGFGMVQLLIDKGHEVVAYDINEDAVSSAVEYGASGANSIEEMVAKLDGSKFVWIMVQRSVVQTVLDELKPLLSPGDTIVDGGNTFYQETLIRSRAAREMQLNYIDVGVSGGVDAARKGACLMVGGDKQIFDQYQEIFRDLAEPEGYGYMGNSGAGHLIKGLHNGIEYGMMQAIGDGIEAIMSLKEQFDLDPAAALRVYNHGSIIESNLTKWLENAWTEDPDLSQIAGSVPTGDTTEEMKQLARLSPNPSLDLAISEREASQETPRFAGKVVAAMRHEFGGHPINKASGDK